MNNIQTTKNLPNNYQEVGHLDLDNNRGLAMILTLIGIGLMFGVGWLLMESLIFLRPEYLSTENILVITGMREFWRSVLLLVVSLGLMVVLNEGIRWVLFYLFTHTRPKLGFRGFFAHASASEWFLPRCAYLLIKLVPLLVITALGIAAIPYVSLNLVPGVMVFVSLNFAAATGDLVQTWWLLKWPKSVLLLESGDGVHVYHSGDLEA